MISALFNDPGQLAMRKMLDAAALRHQAIASNISNLETPNYKRIDVAPSFSSELARAMDIGNGAQIQSLKPSLVVDQDAISLNRDGNTVEMEGELLAMTQNTIAHSFLTQMMTDSFQELRTAITGRTG